MSIRRLDGRRIIVTGGASGMGEAVYPARLASRGHPNPVQRPPENAAPAQWVCRMRTR